MRLNGKNTLGWLLIVIGALAFVPATRAVEPDDAANNAEPLRFQRVTVPDDRPEDWPRDAQQKYVPMPAEEFEHRLALLRGDATETKSPDTARLTRADYTAALGGMSLTGELVWKIDVPAARREILVLNGCRLPLADPEWIGDGKKPARAIVGNDQLGRLAAVVERAGTLHCKWSLQGAKQDDASLVFDLPLPACPISVLEISLPEDAVPAVDHGIVAKLPNRATSGTKWRIEFGAANHVKLQIMKNSADGDSRLRVKQTLNYEISPRGLEFRADFAVPSESGASRRKIHLLADSSLEALRAIVGKTELTVSETLVSNGAFKEFEIELPTAVRGVEQIVQVTAVAPVDTSAEFRLPLVRMKNAQWEQGSAKITIDSPLELADLQLSGCRQIGAQRATKDHPSEIVDIQLFDDQPVMNVVLARREEKISVISGSSVTLRANEGLCHYEADFSLSEGSCFGLEADVAPQWIIDNVESFPVGAIADWTVQSSRGKPPRLKVQLAMPLAPDRDIHLSITGRRRRAPWGDNFRTSDLAMLKFRNVEQSRQIVHVQSLEPYQLQLRGDDNLHRLDVEELTPDEAELVDGQTPGLLFVSDEQALPLVVSLTAKPPQFQAEIHELALVGDNRLTETYRFSITPKGRELGRLVVRFSQPRSEPLLWTVEGEQAGAVNAKRLPDDPATPKLAGDAWEILLPSPSSSSFVLIATRRAAFQGETPLALASVVGADSQQGIVQVDSSGESQPEVRSSRRIKALPVEPPQDVASGSAIAAFRYDPDEDTLLSAEPPLVLAPPTSGQTDGRAWIWQAQLQSIFRRTIAEQTLKCRIDSNGRERIVFTPPANALLKGAWVDQRSVIDEIGTSSSAWQIDLPRGARFVSVVLQWSQPRSASSVVAEETAPWPVCDVPILARDWTVCLPPGVKLVDAEIGKTNAFLVPWSKRLFGPLASSDETVLAKQRDSAAPDDLLGQHPSDTTPSLDSAGWTIYEFSDFGDSAAGIRFVNGQSLTAWAWALFLLTASIRWWIGRKSPALDVAIFGAATAMALIMPTAFTALSAAVWLGLVGGRLLIWVRDFPKFTPTEPAADRASNSSIRQSTVTTISVLLLSLAGGRLFVKAAEPVVPAADTVPTTWQVLIPVDAKGQPAGGFYFLPEKLRAELLQRTPEFDFGPPNYLVTAANYRGKVSASSTGRQLESGSWLAEFEIESLRDGATVELPLGADGSVLIPNGVELDRQPAKFHALENRHAVAVEIPTKGSHHLQIDLQPVVSHGEIDFAVPIAAAIQVEVDSDNLELQINSILPSDKDVNRIRLGPIDRIHVQRRDAAAESGTAQNAVFEIGELYWLRTSGEAINIDARFQVDVKSGRLDHLDFAADPRVNVVFEGEDAPVSEGHRLPGNPDTLRLELAQPISGKATVDVVFSLAGAASVGHCQVPQIKALGGTIDRQWWAASADGELKSALPIADEQQIKPEEFAAAWGDTEKKPQLAWNAAAGKSEPVLELQPKQSELSAKYLTSLLIDSHEVRVESTATVSANAGGVYLHRIQVPPQMEIQRIAARHSNAEQTLRWSRIRPDLVTILFDAAAKGETQLSISARLPTPAEGTLTAPMLEIEGVSTTSRQLIVLRQHDILASVADAAGFESLAETQWPAPVESAQHEGLIDSDTQREGKTVAILEAGGNAASPIIRIERNLRQVRVMQATTIERTGDNWNATVDLDVGVEKGLLDALRLELPTNWTGPFEVSPAMSASVQQPPGDQRRLLVLQPDRPLQSNSHLRITGPLTVSPGQRPSVPDVRILGIPTEARFLLLPRRFEQQQLEWDRRGLVAKPLPESLEGIVSDQNAFRSYQLVGENFRAQLKSIERGNQNPQVQLADVAVQWAVSGNYCGIAKFDLKPGDAATCQLSVPAQCKLLRVELDKASAQLSPLGDGQWNLTIGNNRLPRRLEVLFSGTFDQTNKNRWQLPAPSLVGWPVERSLWRVSSPTFAGSALVFSGRSVSESQYALSQLKGAASLLDSAVGDLVDEPLDDIQRWYAQWAERFQSARSAYLGEIAKEDHASSHHVDADLDAIDQDVAQIKRRLAVADPAAEDQAAPAEPSDSSNFLASDNASSSNQHFAISLGDGSPLEIGYASTTTDDRPWRFLLAGLIALGAALAVVGLRRGQISFDACARWPQAIGIFLGVIWWLWLTPGWLGPIIITASVLALWRPLWQPSKAPIAARAAFDGGSVRMRNSAGK